MSISSGSSLLSSGAGRESSPNSTDSALKIIWVCWGLTTALFLVCPLENFWFLPAKKEEENFWFLPGTTSTWIQRFQSLLDCLLVLEGICWLGWSKVQLVLLYWYVLYHITRGFLFLRRKGLSVPTHGIILPTRGSLTWQILDYGLISILLVRAQSNTGKRRQVVIASSIYFMWLGPAFGLSPSSLIYYISRAFRGQDRERWRWSWRFNLKHFPIDSWVSTQLFSR